MTLRMSESQDCGDRSSTDKCISREMYLLVSPYINLKDYNTTDDEFSLY